MIVGIIFHILIILFIVSAITILRKAFSNG